MSQLPWGGRPTSPVDDPDNTTGPGQDAPAGPDPNAEKCDCTCPDYNELPWLPPGDGPGGDPEYTGTYYRLIRCRDDAEQPAWVQTNEFSPGDVLLIETDGVKTCFYVDSEEVPNADVQDTNVIRPADVEADFLTCTACRTSGPPSIVDPDPPLPPILPTSYAQLAFCSDDTLAPLWTPVEVFGVPVAEDLTKIYEIEGVCYYISNNIQPAPGGPLMPVFGATIHNDCSGCLCAQCASATECGNCTCTPDEIALTLAGITLCPDCTENQNNLNNSYSFTLNQAINGTHNLVQNSNCSWSLALANALLTERWTGLVCGGAADESNTADINILLTKISATRFRLSITCPTLVTSPTTSLHVLFFGEIVVAENACASFTGMDNDVVVGDCGTLYGDGVTPIITGATVANVAAYGGTASAVACP